nr:MAG TPA: dUTPase [Caudoviricetes sp.]
MNVIEMANKMVAEKGNGSGKSSDYWNGFQCGALMQKDEDYCDLRDAVVSRILKGAKVEDGRIKIVLEEGATMPAYAHEDDAGMDLISMEMNMIPAHGRETFKTGVHMAIPSGYFGAIRAKSGLLRKHGIICSGTVDCSYTGEIMVTLVNTSSKNYQVFKGDKIAQMILVPYHHAEFVQVEKLDETERGNNGFGSTGR